MMIPRPSLADTYEPRSSGALLMLIFLTAITIFGAFAILEETGCSPAQQAQEAQTARDIGAAVLKAEEIACVMGSLVVNSAELAKDCKIADAVIPIVAPIIHGLIGVRDAARKTGVVYRPGPLLLDAGGAPDAK